MNADATFNPPEERQLRNWQFGLRELLAIIGACAIFLALLKWWGAAGFVVFVVLAVPIWLSRGGQSAALLILKSLVMYCVVSLLTLPFLDAIWLGEIPLLAIVQSPKVELANWIRSTVVMPMIKWLGVSSGSFSPDYILARPYGLMLAYLIPMAIMLTTYAIRRCLGPPYLRWICGLLILVVLDFCFMIIFAGGPGFTIY